MDYTYLASNVISLSLWSVLYWWRKDTRKMMLIMSLLALPLALFDLVFVPSYWVPSTLFGIPVGIEGFLFSFSVGGIAAVLYIEAAKRGLRHIRAWHKSLSHGIWVMGLTLAGFVTATMIGVPNPEVAAYIGIAVGLAMTLGFRPDLATNTLFGALSFGIVYFLALKLWVTLFPETHSWFTFQGLPKLFIWSVPGWEALFGFFFGAYWSNLYELLFGYKLTPLKAPAKRAR